MSTAKKAELFKLFSFLDKAYSDKVLLCDLHDNCSDSNLIRMSVNETSETVLERAKQFSTFYSVQEESHDPFKAMNLAALMIATPEKFFSNTIMSVLNPTSSSEINVTEIINRDFTNLDEKYIILEEIEKAVTGRVNSSSIIYDIESIADEFITNAIFHATSEVENRVNHMKQSKVGNIKLACTENELIISCVDPHGKLNPEKLFSRIYTCITTDIASSINMGQGDAGIGSFLVHGMSTYYIVAVEENKRTIITSVLPLKMSNRKRLKLPKNLFSLFIKEKQDG